MFRSQETVYLLFVQIFISCCPLSFSFIYSPCTNHPVTALNMVGLKVGKKYEPKWKKKETLAEKDGGKGPVHYDDIGIKGNIPVVFRMGNETKTTMAFVGQPIKDLASQSGQFIKYGCGKGECGTCEALCNGKWIRPCTAVIPADLDPGMDYVIQVKDVKAKRKSSGKFYSVKSFFMGFYNNLLGMVGFVLTRRQAKKNFDERMEFEDLVQKLAQEKKTAKAKAAADETIKPQP